MKLAEALILRSDLQKRIEQLKVRIMRNTKVQEGDQPAEDPEILLKELAQLLDKLEILIRKINRTNSNTFFNNELTLSDVLAKRDVLGWRREILRDTVESASIKQDRFSKSEVKFYSTVEVQKLQRNIDQLSKEYRELDTKIQELNWKTDVMD